MINVVITIAVILVLLLINEFRWRRRDIHTEVGRKFIHITVGSFVAFWPFFLTWHQIQALSVTFLVVVIASKSLKLFQAIHSVQRPTLGELFFALAVGTIAIVTHDKWIYAAALMQMALADGLAAILGVQFGNGLKYLIFKYPKSAVGTLTFFIVSFVILLGYNQLASQDLSLSFIAGVSLVATIVENLAVWGLDNLLVPLVVALLLVNH